MRGHDPAPGVGGLGGRGVSWEPLAESSTRTFLCGDHTSKLSCTVPSCGHAYMRTLCAFPHITCELAS